MAGWIRQGHETKAEEKPLPRIYVHACNNYIPLAYENTPYKTYPSYVVQASQPHRLVSRSDISKGVRLIFFFVSCCLGFVLV